MLALLAQTDYSSDAAGAAVATAAGGLILFWVIFWIIFGVVGLIFFIWWIILIVDLTKRDFPEKSTWLIIMIVGLLFGFVWLADLLYYFMVVKKYGKAGGATPSAPATPAPK